ncbi:MAG: hypothetical protein D6677_11250 [Calditrichaeota bacterium]|nr:MAG: hypothetical protein D6677_11250 [Calditrichota bacterium]
MSGFLKVMPMSKFSIISEYFAFLKNNKKWWLLPLAVILVLLGALIVLTGGSALAPFIYTLF